MKKKLKILFVEDIKHDYIAMNRALDKSELDCKILWVKQGKDAIQHLCSASFDIVLIDYKLPDENGLELLKEIKKKKLDVPVVFVAASGNESIAAEAIKLGAQDYIVKDPLGRYLEIIPDVIKKALGQWKAEQNRKQSAEELRKSEERYRAFVQNSSEGIWCFEGKPISIDLGEDEIIERIYATATLVECNDTMAKMYGFKKREDIIGTRLENLLVPTDERNIEYLKNFIHSDFRLIDGESYEPDVKGKVHIYLNNFVGIVENGYLVRAWGSQRDITERKQQELLRKVRVQLLDKLRDAKTIKESLQLGCEAIRDAALFKRAVSTLHNEKREITHLGQVGLNPKSVESARKAPPPDKDLVKKITQKEFQISHSYFVPKEAAIAFKQMGRYIPQRLKPSDSKDSWKPGDELFVPIFSKEGSVEGYLSVDTPINGKRPDKQTILYLEDIVDIVARQIHEIQNLANLRESEERFRAIFETAQDSIFTKDKSLKYTHVNPAMEKLFGLPASRLIEMTDDELFGKEAGAYIRETDYQVLNGEIIEDEHAKPVKGVMKTFHLVKIPMHDNTGKVIGLYGIARDITERKKAEQIQSVLYHIADAVNTTSNLDELYKLIHIQLGTIVDTTNFYIALYDEKTNIITAPYYVDQLKKTIPPPQPLKNGLTAYVIRNAKPLYLTVEKREKLIKEGKIAQADWKSKIWIGAPLKTKNQVIGALAIQSYTDASLYTEKDMEILEFVSDQIAAAIERKKAEEALQKSEEKYRLISETTSDIIALTTFSLNPVFTYVSPSIKSFGYEIEDVIGKPCFDFIHPDDKKKLFPLLKKYVSAKSKKLFSGKDSDISEIIENRVIDKYGNWHYFQSTANILGNQILIISKNITVRKKAEQALQASEAQYHGIFDSAIDSFLIFDLDGNIMEANPQACKMYGYPYKELVKLSGKDIVHPDYYHLFENFKKDVKTTGKFHTESVDVHKNGTTFNVEVRGTAFHYKGKKHLLAVIRDITERKKAEEALKKKNEELEAFNKLVIGRELRMIELKKEVNELLEKLGKKAKYKAVE